MRQQLTHVRSFTYNLPELMSTVAESASSDCVGASGPPFLGSHSISLRSKGFPPARKEEFKASGRSALSVPSALIGRFIPLSAVAAPTSLTSLKYL